MKICYLSGDEINESTKSLEHIIPNALGGILKSKYVITHDSNQKLNQDIDVHFNSIFESAHQRLELNKDRGKAGGVKAFHRDFEKEIIVRNGKCYPIEPFFDSENNIVYASSKKIGLQFSNKIAREYNISADAIKVLTDMAGQFEIRFGFDNAIFKKGIAKIAAGFATLKGVNRNDLCGILDLINNEIKDDIVVAPFFPTSNEESYFEEHVHGSDYYPMHSVILYGNHEDKLLYCYVELFSTFQYFIVLNDNYQGEEIYESYFHSLKDNKVFSYSEYSKSIPNSEGLSDALPSNFRKYPEYYIKFMNNHVVEDPERVKEYTYFKSNTLNSYINYVSTKAKLDMLSECDRKNG